MCAGTFHTKGVYCCFDEPDGSIHSQVAGRTGQAGTSVGGGRKAGDRCGNNRVMVVKRKWSKVGRRQGACGGKVVR